MKDWRITLIISVSCLVAMLIISDCTKSAYRRGYDPASTKTFTPAP
jgi:hypothetical protein